jgi:threonine dehydrogenase-like Zn-dependent dehydrogenase
MRSKAAVLLERGRFEIDEFEVPAIGEDDALLEVEACGMCGSDVEQYDGGFESLGVGYPVIPGHEAVGRVAAIGASAARRWNVQEGDRIAVEAVMGCGHCEACLTGRYSQCRTFKAGTRVNSYGCIPIATSPSLWGGYSEFMYLDPMSVVHKLDPNLPIELAALYQPMAAGIRWFVHDSGLKLGGTIVVLGSGQRGLAGVVAAREAGAGLIIATGLTSDAHKLDLARRFGADATVVADQENVVDRVMELTGGKGADVVVDVAAVSMQPIVDAIEIAKPGGTIVFAAIKGGGAAATGFVPDKVVSKELTIKGLLSQDTRAVEPALRLIESRRYPLELMHTHTFGLEDIETAVNTLAGRVPGEKAVHVMLDPRS